MTPSCALIAQVISFPSAVDRGIFAIRPADATPAWTHYATGNSQTWRVVLAQSFTLWAFDTLQAGDKRSLTYILVP